MKAFFLSLFLLLSIFSYSQVQVITLNGSASSDPDGKITTYKWTQIGTTPSVCTIAKPDSAITTVVPVGGAQWIVGKYQFRLVVTDNLGASTADTVAINVFPNPDKPPVSNAGSDQTIILPPNGIASATVGGIDVGKNIAFNWEKISGKDNYRIVSPLSSTTQIQFTQAGTYVFRKTVTNLSGSGYDDVSVTVKKKCSWWQFWCSL